MCQRQVEAIQNPLSATQSGIGFNNRVTMPLNHRTVAETNPSLCASTVAAVATETSDITNTNPLAVSVVIIAILVPGGFLRENLSFSLRANLSAPICAGDAGGVSIAMWSLRPQSNGQLHVG